jgi:predicted nucleotidyltransferase
MNKNEQVLAMNDQNKNEQINADEQFEDEAAAELDDDQLEDVAGGVQWEDGTDWIGTDWNGG